MRKLKKVIRVLVVLVLFLVVINIIPPSKAIENNPFIKKDNEKTMLIAHRGGKITNPENTMKAFVEAVNTYNAEVLESDLYLTKDGHLVYNHDAYIDRTCNVNGDMTLEEVNKMIKEDKSKAHYIKDYTLEELEQFNFGYYFEKDGVRPYKDLTMEEVKEEGLQIVEMSKLFKQFYETNKDLLFVIEIKNTKEENGFDAVDKLAQALDTYKDYKNQVVIGTFNPEIEDYLKTNHTDLYRGASTKGAAIFIITQILKVNIFDTNDIACLQIPMEYEIKDIELELDKRQYIRRAHRRNIAVQYWTINERDDMIDLIRLGCDGIMTDDLELGRRVIDSYYR